MKMRDCDSQFEQDRTIHLRHVEECPFRDFLYPRELLRFGIGEVGEILGVPGENEHRVTANRGIGMKQQLPVAEIDDELAG